jgi:hypothetical protein
MHLFELATSVTCASLGGNLPLSTLRLAERSHFTSAEERRKWWFAVDPEGNTEN